jgi:hypothetical protein
MALIPGTLPNDTCYGTPQDLLELFAQYLDVPALALNSKVFFSTEQPNTSDAIWFNTINTPNVVLNIKIGGLWTDYVSNYIKYVSPNLTTKTVPGTGDYVIISDVSSSGVAKKTTAQAIANLAPAPSFARTVVLRDVQASGTAGVTPVAGGWRTRVLNTMEPDTNAFCTLSANQFTLVAGTWEIMAKAPGYQVDKHKMKLRNTTDSSDTLIGSSEATFHTGVDVQTSSHLAGIFTIASSKVFEIQHYVTFAAGSGFGYPSTFAVSEVYAMVVLRKLA